MTNSADLAIMKMVTDVIIAQVSNNKTDATLLPQLMSDLYNTLKGMEAPRRTQVAEPPEARATTQAPAVTPAPPRTREVVNSVDEELETSEEDIERTTAARNGAAHESWEEAAVTQIQGRRPQEGLVPAVPIEESVQPDRIICLEDGKEMIMLKRYLRTRYNMTPEQYKAKWGLPHDYPMVAPEYSKQKSELARLTGLGKIHRGTRRKSASR